MARLIPGIPQIKSIKNIIFDFGGVICDIDIKRTEKKFFEMGLKRFENGNAISKRDDLFRRLEKGGMPAQEFRNSLKRFFTRPVTDKEIDDAWNALLLDIPLERIRLLEDIRKTYRIFLLSNSNEIHYQKYLSDFRNNFGYQDFDRLFEKAYFSFNIHLQKPDVRIFEFVLNKSGLKAPETLFIDDSLQHIEGAENAGIIGYHLKIKEGEQITDLFC